MEIVDQIRQVADIIEIASQYTTLKRRGKRWVGLCPFHSEKTPSFTVDEEKQLYHCFGCGAGGDFFTLIMEKEKLSFPETIKYLCQKYNIPFPEKEYSPQKKSKSEDLLYKVHEEALAFFRKNLFNTSEGKKALDYLTKRGISEEIIQGLKIGYALKSWDALYSYFINKNISPSILERAGLVLPSQKKEGYYDRFRGRIIFPIFNLTGKVIAFGGRSLFDEEPKYLNSPDTPIYLKGKSLYGLNISKDYIRKKGIGVLVEGYTDFIALYQAGIKNVVASLGTSLTSEQISLLSRFTRKININYDSDQGGQAASLRSVSLCLEKGMEVEVLILPPGDDPDSYLKEIGQEKYQRLIEKSQSGFEFLVHSLIKSKNLDIPEEKAIVSKEILNIISKIPNSIIRSEYLKKISEYLDIDEFLLRATVKLGKEKQGKEEEKEGLLPAEKRLLQIIIEEKTLASKILSHLKTDDFQGLKSEQVFRCILDGFYQNKEIDFTYLSQNVDSSLLSSVVQFMMENKYKPSLEEAMDCLYALRRMSLERKLKEIQKEINKWEREGNIDKLNSLLDLKQRITKDMLTL
ncbi:MAG: DNA primase [Candidatus Aminicenantia bacterium]